MHDLLRRLVTRSLPSGRVIDGAGRVRLIIPQYTFADFLRVAVAEVWRYGGDSPQVPERLGSMLRDLHAAARPEHRSAVRRWWATVSGTRGDG